MEIDERMVELVRERLRAFPLYEESHVVSVSGREDLRVVGYLPNWECGVDQTKFWLNIQSNKGYILDFRIEECKRRQGNGRRLYRIIEGLLKELGCNEIILTASGYGLEFWPKMGFDIDKDKCKKRIV